MNSTVATFGVPGANVMASWAALGERATTNVFMHPAALRIAADTRFAPIEVLQAWRGTGQDRLVGLWAVRRSILTSLGPACIATPAYEFAFVSNPVLDLEFMDETAAAFLSLIASDDRLPGVLRLRYLDADCPSYAAIVGALAARGARTLEVSRRTRPFATRALGRKLRGATRDKLRQRWNRLCACGPVEVRNDAAPDAVRDAFETFLRLEQTGWKGASGTALASNAGDAAFARRFIGALADDGNASVAMLTLRGRTIAAQVLLYAGTRAYTWKTAFDEAFGEFSPGSVLVDQLTEQLLAGDSIQAIESCSPEGGFMGRIWDGRRTTVDLVADLRSTKPLQFGAAAFGARSYAQLREVRNALREATGRAMPSPGGAKGG